MTKDTCLECQFFGKNACSHNVTDPDHEKCGDFYRRRDSEKEKPKKPIRKTCGLAVEGSYEAIVQNSKPMFLVHTNNSFEIMEKVTDSENTVLPKAPNQYPYVAYEFEAGAIPNREELFWLARNEFGMFLDVESIYQDFLVSTVLLSYQQEKVDTVPYVFFVGDNESGKTVALSLLNWLCYRPLMGVTIPAADIYGFLDDVDAIGTILEDEIQGIEKDIDKTKIYKAGYKAGAKVPRFVESPEGKAIHYYPCFCLKFCAGEEIPRLKGFKERFILTPMVEGLPKKDWADLNGEDKKRFMHLRNTLLKWRLASRTWQIPELEIPARGRLKELWKPVMQVVSGLTVEKDLTQYLTQLQADRMDEKKNALEGRIVHVVADHYKPDESLEFFKIWDSLQTELNASIDTKNDSLMHSGEYGEITKSRVGYRLRELFGGKKTAERDKATKRLVWAYTLAS